MLCMLIHDVQLIFYTSITLFGRVHRPHGSVVKTMKGDNPAYSQARLQNSGRIVFGSQGLDKKPSTTRYPGNIGVLYLLYFWFAPTLCNQPDYPKAESTILWIIIHQLVPDIHIRRRSSNIKIHSWGPPKSILVLMSVLSQLPIVGRRK